MLIWGDVLLVVLAVVIGAAGLKLLKRSGQSKQTALGALADRRNGVSCILLSFLLLFLEVYINL